MTRSTPPGLNVSGGALHYLRDQVAATKTNSTCRCGSKIFREVHRIAQPNGSVSTVYECEKCGEYSL